MKKRVYLIAGICLVVILVLILARRPHPQVPAPPSDFTTDKRGETMLALSENTNHSKVKSVGTSSLAPGVESLQKSIEIANRQVENEISMWQAPLIYFGKVVDESNKPISGVTVLYSARAMNAAREEIRNKGTVLTDDRGIFKIDGVNGVGLMLELSHPRYYLYPNSPTSFDKRALPRKGYFSETEEKAEIFRMHSKGHPVPLVHRRGGADVPVNNGSAIVELRV